jgi:hypothetical protein
LPLEFEMINTKNLLLGIFIMIFGSCNPTLIPNPVVTKSAYAPVSSSYIENLDERIADIKKGDSVPISQLLSHLGLWKYRKQVEISRKTNMVCLYLNDSSTEWILFIAEDRIAITREKIDRFVNWWELGINDLHIYRIIFRGVITDLT